MRLKCNFVPVSGGAASSSLNSVNRIDLIFGHPLEGVGSHE